MIESIINSIYSTVLELLPLAMIFFLLSVLVKKKKAFDNLSVSAVEAAFNLAIMLLNIIVLMPVFIALSGVFSSYNIGLVKNAFWDGMPKIIVIFMVLFIGDFIGYWRHRFEHSTLLWPSHRLHHSDTQLSWLTLHRFHPFNRLSTYIIDNSFLLLLGFPPDVLLANNVIRHYYGYYLHANLPWSHGKLSCILISPVMHQSHHSRGTKGHNNNYATFFSVFDIAFGTYKRPEGEKLSLGFSKSVGGFFSQVIYPFRPSAYQDLVNSFKIIFNWLYRQLNWMFNR